MKQQHLGKYGPAIILILLMIFSMNAWNQSGDTRHSATDTIPGNKMKIRNIDDAARELDKAAIEFNKTDWNKIEKEIEEAMKKIDLAQMKLDLQKGLKEMDVNKMKADIDKALKEIDVAKMKVEMDASLAKIDVEKIKRDMHKIKEIDLSKIEMELQKIKPEIERSMKEAKAGIEKAKKEISEYKSFINNLEKDGLINKKDGYIIEHKNGELIINGKKQSAEVYSKYRNFLEKHKEFSIRQTDDDFNIDMD